MPTRQRFGTELPPTKGPWHPTGCLRYGTSRCAAVTWRNVPKNTSGVVGLHELLQGLQQEYALEPDPGKRRELLEQMSDLIEKGWEELFLSLSNEENPQQVLLLLKEFNRVLKLRRQAIQEADPYKRRDTL